MKILAHSQGDDWNRQQEFAEPFGIHLGSKHGASASEVFTTVYFKSGRDIKVEDQGPDTVLLCYDISGTTFNLILELDRVEAMKLRAKCAWMNNLREELDEAQSLGDFVSGPLLKFVKERA